LTGTDIPIFKIAQYFIYIGKLPIKV